MSKSLRKSPLKQKLENLVASVIQLVSLIIKCKSKVDSWRVTTFTLRHLVSVFVKSPILCENTAQVFELLDLFHLSIVYLYISRVTVTNYQHDQGRCKCLHILQFSTVYQLCSDIFHAMMKAIKNLLVLSSSLCPLLIYPTITVASASFLFGKKILTASI